jgi:flagellum-specific peptidoglycan hydrolase FlgJ
VTRLQFISAIKPSCVTAQEAFGIPWGWFVAQAIQESGGYGKSDLSINAHNLYGIKDTGADAYYQGKVGYAKFPTWHDAIQFQGWQLSQSRYLPFKVLAATGKFKEYGDAISKAGWCPVSIPTYGDAIQSLAEQYNLLPEKKPKALIFNEGQKFAVDAGIIAIPDSIITQEQLASFMATPVDVNRLCWALMKAKGKG